MAHGNERQEDEEEEMRGRRLRWAGLAVTFFSPFLLLTPRLQTSDSTMSCHQPEVAAMVVHIQIQQAATAGQSVELPPRLSFIRLPVLLENI
jgi:hypothetical protein